MYHYVEVKSALGHTYLAVGPEFIDYEQVIDYISTELPGIDRYRITSYPESILVDYPYLDEEEC